MKSFRVEVAFQGDKVLYVSAKNAREAASKAKKRVGKMNIGSSIRNDWTDVQEQF